MRSLFLSIYLRMGAHVLFSSIAALLFVIAWLLPNHHYPWSMFYNDFMAWAGLLVLTFGLLRRMGEQSLRLPESAILVASMALIPCLQWSLGRIYYLGDAVMASFYLLGLALAIVVGSSVADSRKSADWLAWVILIGAAFSVFLALHQWLRLGGLGVWLVDMPPNGRPYANLAQPNNLASLLCLGVAAAVYLRERGFFGRIVLAAIVTLLFSGVAMTRSRMAIIVAFTMVVLIFWGIKHLQLRCARREALTGLAMFIGLWLLWPTISELLFLFSDSSLERLSSAFGLELRWVLWVQFLDAATRQPWLGWGWNQLSLAQIAVAADYPNSVFSEHAHNYVLDILCWNGIVMGGAIVVLGFWWIVRSIAGLNTVSAWFGMLIILILATHSMFEFPLDYGVFLAPFGIAIGIVEAGRGRRDRLVLPRGVFAGAAGLGVLVCVWVFVEYQAVESDYLQLRFESAGLEPRPSDARAPDVVLLSQLREFIRFARTEAKEGMTEIDLEWMRRVSSRFANPPAMFRYALALGLNGKYEEATLQLVRLRNLHPPIRYQEAIEGWRALEQRYPKLKNVKVPNMRGEMS